MQTVIQVLVALGILWVLLAVLVVAGTITGMAGQRFARRAGRQCPDCDYRDEPEMVRFHHALDHPRE